ncbi:MAG: formylglycine-generating enzyme family protein [Candidatus Firestonebacteria bacterium]|nr:formylglycine-generating enzyme family protein [Candidatus Firestonebacteria bacterium]
MLFIKTKRFYFSSIVFIILSFFLLYGCAGTQNALKEGQGESDSTKITDTTKVKTEEIKIPEQQELQVEKKPEISVPEPALPAVPEEPNMVYIPAGEFDMGCDKGGDAFEAPMHKVKLSAYYIDKNEVTNEDYKKFIDDGGYTKKELWSEEGFAWKEKNKITGPQYMDDSKYNNPKQPVCGVSFYEAEAYAKWAGKRLPTEAEWEKAARGTDARTYPWGNEYKKGLCNNKDENIKKPTEVCKYANGLSPYGLYDMAGNVNEWCTDYFSADFYKKGPKDNPKGPDKGDKKVIRGGGHSYDTYYCRTTRRGAYDHGQRSNSIGFRCVKDAK